MTAARKIAVIGGGIGGLSAAVGLRQAGFEVDVYEQAPELTEIGGGINMGPNAARILYRLGPARRPRPRGCASGRQSSTPLAGWPHLAARLAQPALRTALWRAAHDDPPRRSTGGHRRRVSRPSGSISAIGLSGSPIAAMWPRPGSTTARISRPMCWSAPTASIRRCAPRYSAKKSRNSPAVSPIAGWSRPNGSPISILNSARNPGSGRARIWCTTSSRAGGSSILSAGPSTTPGTARIGPTAPRSSARSPPLRAGIRRSGGSSPPPKPVLSGRCSIAIRCRAGRSGARRCSATPVTRCTRLWVRVRRRRSRTARALAACLAAGADDPAAALLRYERLRLPRVTRLQQMSRANKYRFHMPDGPEQQARDAEWARAADRSPEALRWLFEHDPAAIETVPA